MFCFSFSKGQLSGGDGVSYDFNMASLADHLKKQSEQGASTYYNIDIIKYEVWINLSCYIYSQVKGILGTFWVFLTVLINLGSGVLVLWSRQLTLIWVLNGQVSREVKGYAYPESLKLRGSERLFYTFSLGDMSWKKSILEVMVHHILTPCLLSSYSLDCPETRKVKVHSHSRKPVLSQNYSLQVTHVLFHEK